MTIQLDTESVLTLPEAAEIAHVRRETVWAWVTQGAGGIKLRAGKLGRQWFTSHEAMQEFQEALTDQQDRDGAKPPKRKRKRPADPGRSKRVADWQRRWAEG